MGSSYLFSSLDTFWRNVEASYLESQSRENCGIGSRAAPKIQEFARTGLVPNPGSFVDVPVRIPWPTLASRDWSKIDLYMSPLSGPVFVEELSLPLLPVGRFVGHTNTPASADRALLIPHLSSFLISKPVSSGISILVPHSRSLCRCMG